MSQYEDWELVEELYSPINMFLTKKDVEDFIKVSTKEEIRLMAIVLEEEKHKYANLLKQYI